MRLALALALGVAVLAPAGAAAQPSAPPTGEPTGALQRDYDAAFDAMLAGDLTAAIAGFDRVAASATGDLAASARELSRMARELSDRRVRFVVAPRAEAGPAVAPDDQPGSGRVTFVASSTAAGLYTGITIVDIADVDDFRAGTLIVVGTTGASFTASLLGSRGRDLTSGMADAYSTGLLVGAGNGLLLASPIGLDGSEEILGAGLAGMVLGGGVALGVADRTRPTVGQSSLVSTLSFLGFASAGLGVSVAGVDDISGDALLTLLAGGLDAGALAGLLVSPRIRWSKGRARLVQLGSLLGGLAGLGIAAIITGEPTDEGEARLMAASTLGGLWGGFGLAIKLTDSMEPDPRFAAGPGDRLSVAPTWIGDAPGLVAGGRF